MELILEVEVARVDIYLSILICPLEHSLRLIALIELPLKLVLFCNFLTLPMKKVF